LGNLVIDENDVLCLIDFGLQPVTLRHGVDCKIKKASIFILPFQQLKGFDLFNMMYQPEYDELGPQTLVMTIELLDCRSTKRVNPLI
jgi:tRNA A-37 threonylcarbamoyl transferase component Bud32